MATPEAEEIARHFMDAEGETIVRDMAGHLGDQLFETLRRNGMMMRSVAGAVGVLTLCAAQVLVQAEDFLRRSMADESDGEPAIEPDAVEAAAIATLFLGELTAPLRLALQAPAQVSTGRDTLPLEGQ